MALSIRLLHNHARTHMLLPDHCFSQSQTPKVWVLIQKEIHSLLHLGRSMSLVPFLEEEAAETKKKKSTCEKTENLNSYSSLEI